MTTLTALSLADLEAFDVGTPPGQGERRFCCPLAACADKPVDVSHRSLSLNTATGAWRCHRCGAGGRLVDHWEDRPRLAPQARRQAALRRAFALSPSPPPAAAAPDDDHWRDQLAGLRSLAGSPGEAYLAGRGIPLAVAEVAGVQFTDVWFGRPGVTFPLHDQQGALVATGVRYTDRRDDPKTRIGGRLKLGVFATPGALAGDTVVIVEGPADALSLALCGMPAVALHRTGAPDWLVKMCAFRRVLVGLDADAAGDRASVILIDVLRSYGAQPERLRPFAKDWNEQLQRDGTERLRRLLFDRLAGPAWQAAWKATGRSPHVALEAAIDAADWTTFQSERTSYLASGVACTACR